MSLAISVLGPLSADRQGASVALGGAKQRLLFGVFVAHRRDALTADQLCDALWGDVPPAGAATTLHSYVSRLRRTLAGDGSVELRNTRYALSMSNGTVDADRFEDAIAAVTGSLPDDAVTSTLGEALSWWHGPAFGDLADNSWIRPEAIRLDELRLSATERWFEARLHRGDDLELVGDLERLTAMHPLRETFWRQLMHALYRSGRQAEALRRGSELSRMRRDELGLDPSPVTRELERRMLDDDPTLLPTPPSRSTSPTVIVDLPTRLVGRGDDLGRLAELLATERLVTLVGPGGVGKTRLARRIGADRTAAGGPATMVELTVVRDPDAVASAVATAVDVQQRLHGTVDDALTEFLRERDHWLLLDNCEHVIGAVAKLVGRLIATCPRVRVLATSREPLGVAGEAVYSVAPLPIPDGADDGELAASPAVQLFCERAAAAWSGFDPDAAPLPLLARLCRRLDGLPLAIELAAVRARSIGLEAMIDRLDRRFSLLDAGPRHAGERHRNLHNMVAWSYDLLESDEQRLFDRLSVFAGSFELPAVEAICTVDGHPTDLLFTLVDRSMVQVVDLDEPRYGLLETLREFGRERLDEAGAQGRVGRRHLEWFIDLTERARVGLDGPDERAWSDRIERDFDNVRTAYSFAMAAGDLDSALRLVRAIGEFSFRKMRYEVTSWAAAAANLPGALGHASYPAALATVAYGHYVRGELDAAIAVGHEAVDAADRLGVDSDGLAERSLGNAYFYRGNQSAALSWIDQMLDVAKRTGQPGRLAHGLYMRSVAETSVGGAVRGAVLAGEARAAAAACRSPTASAQAGYALGLALGSSEPDAGRAELGLAADRAAAAGNRWVEAFARTEVYWSEARNGRPRTALRGFQDVIDTWYRGGDWANQWLSVRHVMGIFGQIGRHEDAAVVHGGLETAGAAEAMPFEPADAARLAASIEEMRAELGDERFAAAVTRGAAMSDRELLAFVLDRISTCLG